MRRLHSVWLLSAMLLFAAIRVESTPALAKDVIRLSGWDLAIRDSLDSPKGDPNGAFKIVAGSVWQTDLGSYRFDEGTLTFLRQVGGRPSGCYFAGKGQVEYEPPTPIERGQLHRFCRDSSLSATFNKLFISFFDSGTMRQVRGLCDTTAVVAAAKDSELRDWHKRVESGLATNLAAAGWRRLLREEMPGSFLIITGQFEGHDPLFFYLDDADDEAISVYQRPKLLVGDGNLDLVCSYDRQRMPEEHAHRAGLVGRGLTIVDYQTDVTIKGSTEMVIDVKLRLVPRRDDMRDVGLLLAPNLEVDTVWIEGDTIPFLYSDAGGGLVARPSDPLHMRDTVDMRILYRGKELLYKFPWGDFFINYTTSWLPVTRPFARAHYHTTFRFPRHYDLVSSGELLGDTVVGDWRIKNWRTYNPASFISFNYGSFDMLSYPMQDGPRLDVYRSRNHLQGLFGRDIKKTVAADIEGAIQLFSRAFGPYQWPHLAATEIPSMHGQGFPQMLHLAWYSFETSKKGVTDAFHAHEVAHQWFGHLVGWTSYHDVWLSEGIAEYAGAMYVQARHPGNKIFLDLIKQWRSDILDVGGLYGWHAGAGVAPIWLGYRCNSSGSPVSYQKLIYSKGAYVIHMLRNMFHDYRRGSDHKFEAMMRDYVSSHAHREASTRDFQDVVERHAGEDMQWFFDQWVYGVQIPRYEYSWDRRKNEDGQWTVSGRIDQLDVDSSFRVYMPVTLVFDEGRRTFVQQVNGASAEFTTPPFAERPKDVIFNDYLTILCREKVVRKP